MPSDDSTAGFDNIANAIVNLGGKARVLPCDLSAPGGPQRLIDDATRDGEPLDALVNCAGVSYFGMTEEL